MKRKIKDFSKFVNEELEMRDEMYGGEETETMPITKPVTKPRPGIGTIPAPVPGTEPDPQGSRRFMDDTMDDEFDTDMREIESEDDGVEYEDNIQTEEEEGVYIGTKLMEDLADELGVEIVDNQINYNGHVINFYSETEAFDIDGESYTRDERGKKTPIKTVEQVLDFLNKGQDRGMTKPSRMAQPSRMAEPTRMMEERFRAGRGRPGRI